MENAKVCDFLEKCGLDREAIQLLVEKERLNTMEVIKMLAELDDSVLNVTSRIPIGIILKIRKGIQSGTHEGEDNSPNDNKEQKETDSCSKNDKKELSKTEIIQLAKTNIDAQNANYHWNEFNKTIHRMVTEFRNDGKWEGSGALKFCGRASHKESGRNSILAAQIINCKELKDLYGVYEVKGHGVVTLTPNKAKAKIGKSHSHMVKPSSYLNKRKSTCDKNGRPKRGKAIQEKETMGEVPTGTCFAAALEGTIEETGSSNSRNEQQQETSSRRSPIEGMQSDDQEEDTDEEVNHESEYVKACNEKRKENEAKLLELKLLNSDQALTVALFKLGIKKKSLVTMQKARDSAKTAGILVERAAKKDELLIKLGKSLFEKDQVVLIDPEKGVLRSNLKLL